MHKKGITKTALITAPKSGVFDRAVFGIENLGINAGVLDPKFSILLFFALALLVVSCSQEMQQSEPVAAQIAEEPIQNTSAAAPDRSPEDATPAIEGMEETWSQRKVPCAGDFFDTHAHYDGLAGAHGPGGFTPEALSIQMKQHQVGCAVLFVSSLDMNAQFDEMRESLSTAEVGLLPFFPILDMSQLSAEGIRTIYAGREEAFYGIGEMAFYEGGLVGTSLAEDPWPAIFEYAGQHNLFIMLHPTQRQANDVEKMLAAYPDTKVILHGYESLSTGSVEEWLRTYKNLYFTYDIATMLDGYLYRIQNERDFLVWYGQNKQRYLGSVRSKLLPLLQAAPDQVMWGTDVVAAWHVQPEVYGEIIDFSRELVDSLPVENRDKYAYANAQRIFGPGVRFEKK